MKDFASIIFSDGHVATLTENNSELVLEFVNWEEGRFNIAFKNTLSYKVFNLINEDLSHGIEETINDYINEVLEYLNEEDKELICYSLISAWSGNIIFSVIAKSFEIIPL